MSVNILDNNIGTEQAQKLIVILKEHATLKSLCGNKGDETELDMSGNNMRAEGTIMLAPEIVANGSLTSLNVSKNEMLGAEAGKAFATAIAANTVLKELDLSGHPETDELYARPNIDVAFAKEFAVGLGGNGALTSLDISNNRLGELVLPSGWTEDRHLFGSYDKGYKHTDGRRQKDHPGKPEGVIAIANAILTMGALTTLDLSSNDIGPEGAKHIAEAVKANVSALRCDWYHFEPDLTSGSTAVVCGYCC